MACFRVKYRLEYSNDTGLYRFPKAPELIKIAHSVAPDTFFDSGSDYAPIWFDAAAIDYDYGHQIFCDVENHKNMFFTSGTISGTCINKVYDFIKRVFYTSDIPGDNVSGDYVPGGDEQILIG